MLLGALAVVLVYVGAYALDTTTPHPPGTGGTQPPYRGPVPTIEVKDVGVIGGKCSYGGLMLEPTTLNLMKEPCEAWTCDAENYTLTIQSVFSCDRMAGPDNWRTFFTSARRKSLSQMQKLSYVVALFLSTSSAVTAWPGPINGGVFFTSARRKSLSQMQKIPLHQASLAPRVKHSLSQSFWVQLVTAEIASTPQIMAVTGETEVIEEGSGRPQGATPRILVC
ncbi:hypothetical protein HPB50_000653 [Hyalomma asiaticum]|uniref:Uncharacterized protein n=1 Tax=Hyalomma asiaticum TaxID=266040 RepID=A0ACB7T7G3_HYAAI|nr:hypothetical protein HPB50_000653 [Hyalomma asiaticum]